MQATLAANHYSTVRIVLQRVKSASVTVEGEMISEIGGGLLLLVGVAQGDGESEADWLAGKVARIRIFGDEEGKMNLSVKDAGGGILAVSQFTLLADTRKGNRPSFIRAALPGEAEPLFDYYFGKLRDEGTPVQTCRFGTMM